MIALAMFSGESGIGSGYRMDRGRPGPGFCSVPVAVPAAVPFSFPIGLILAWILSMVAKGPPCSCQGV